ncbi:divalent-cation tolerance protein CutA [bacterium]|nr:divalent-cation tolerance protein CutA [bacterium]
MTDYILVQTTTNSLQEAEKIASEITGLRLAACTQIDGPITSVYHWKGQVEKDSEWRCSFKTSRNLFKTLETRIKEIHTYETPEIIAIPILETSSEYAEWMKNELEKGNL